MITGALNVISNTPAALLNPLVLPRALGSAFLGYITVAHGNSSGTIDLLFLEGKSIRQCGRMNRDVRMAQSLGEAEARIAQDDRHASVSLFHAPRPALERFIATLRYEPCLKLQIETVSKQQLERLIRATCCRSGILEVVRWDGIIPSIELSEFESLEELRLPNPHPRRGRLMLYDRGSNLELLGEPEKPPASERLIIPDFPVAAGPPQPSPTILLDPAAPPHPPPALLPAEAAGGSPPGSDQIPLGFPPEPVPQHVILFEALFQSFIGKLDEICKGKSELLIARAERKSGPANSPPRAKQLTAASALAVLDLIEFVVKDVPLLKRSKVKSAALELVAELYNKHHDLLESAGCVDRVEQTYYQLKG